MQEVSFEEALELIRARDPRYEREAYQFVKEALDYTQKTIGKDTGGRIRHVTGQELLAGIRDFALTQFGPMAITVLGEWGIRKCEDIGEIVFNMVETGASPTFLADDIKDPAGLAARLEPQSDPVSRFLWSEFSAALRLEAMNDPQSEGFKTRLLKELNAIIRRPIYESARFADVLLSPQTRALVGARLQGVSLAQFNRLLLEDAFPLHIAKSRGLLAKTDQDSRADFVAGYDFEEAFREPFLPPSKLRQRPATRTASPGIDG